MITNFLLNLFKDIDEEMKKANIKEDLISYVKKSEKYIILTVFSMAFAGFMLGSLLSLILLRNILIFIPLIMSIGFSVIGFLIGVIFFRSLPSIKASERKRKIDYSIYFATIYMAALASSGVNPLNLFELLAKYKEFSEIGKDSKEIYDLVTTMGISLPVALHYKAMSSPSRNWKEVLEGIRSILLEGGSLDQFLYGKAKQFAEEYKRNLIEYSNTIQVLLEVYITLVVVGIIFTIILTTLMGSIAGSSQMIFSLQLFSVLILLPMATILFILIIKSINPSET
ncbi:MAG: type II secretion system F family protein [Nanopusillaceae archaeon]